MKPKVGSIGYSSNGMRTNASSSYASSDRVGCHYNMGNGVTVGGYASRDSSKVGGSGYGAGIEFKLEF